MAIVTALVMVLANTATAQSTDITTHSAGCVVRFKTAVPQIQSDSRHICDGASGLYVESNGDLGVTGTRPEAIKTAFCQPDEQLALRGIVCGASERNRHTVYRFYDTRYDRPVERIRRGCGASTATSGWGGWSSGQRPRRADRCRARN